VDIELYDALQRLRFEHRSRAVILTSGKSGLLRAPTSACSAILARLEVNFCKFTNETRNAIEEARASRSRLAHRGQRPCAGRVRAGAGTEWIVMADDGNTAVSLPSAAARVLRHRRLTRLVDKRKVRRTADFFCTTEEGVKGARAVDGASWTRSCRARLAETVTQRAAQLAAKTDRPRRAGVALTPLARNIEGTASRIRTCAACRPAPRDAEIHDGARGAPAIRPPRSRRRGFLRCLARELDDLILHLARTRQVASGSSARRRCRTSSSP